MSQSKDSFNCKSTLEVNGKKYQYYDLVKAEQNGLKGAANLPKSLKVLLENLLRYEDGSSVDKGDIEALAGWAATRSVEREIAYRPARVLMQDFTGVPAVVDLASMRAAMQSMGGDPKKINPLSPVDLVIDHSLSIEHFGNKDAFEKNVEIEFQRNKERYEFLRWGQKAFDNFRVVPPGTGICHQVNLEYLAKVVWDKNESGETLIYPDTLVGTDSHTTMINGLAVLGWGVGGIEAEAAMLGQPVSMLIPDVVGFKLTGAMKEGTTATDLVLTVVQMLRKKGVVGKFVEFYGPGLKNLALADRATLANMAPEYGATCGFCPIDEETINYLRFSGRDEQLVKVVEQYAKANGLWSEAGDEPAFTDTLELDMATVEPSIAGPKRPQDRIVLTEAKSSFEHTLKDTFKVSSDRAQKVEGSDFEVKDGDVVIASITSCTNTSNPSVMLAAGLVAKKARALGLSPKPWVKTSLAPGSQVVTEYLVESGLQQDLDALGFNLVGYGCTTCIGNSGPLAGPIGDAITKADLVACSVLSGNRNFEGRVNPHVKANYLASPPLVVAYSIAGSLKVDITKDSLGKDKNGNDVYLKDIWPTNKEVKDTLASSLTPEMFKRRYSDVFHGGKQWQNIQVSEGLTYDWQDSSTYIKNPPFFEGMTKQLPETKDIVDARPLLILGDSVTTDHISPAGAIPQDGPAEKYLEGKGLKRIDFNSFGSRRGNHEVMMRGTFANIRIKNELVGGKEGGYTKKMPAGTETSVFDAAMEYVNEGQPLVVIGGKEYGTGSSRDWAAKGTILLGVKAVITESFERIHRSNLIGMGVLPLQFTGGETRTSLGLDGTETFSITGLDKLAPRGELDLIIKKADGSEKKTKVLVRIDTDNEALYYKNGGILHYVLRNLA